ncbi:MAG: hypothetical protein AB1758_24675, partial [Candidatus Eremiobacterota bacterium]
MRSAPPRSEHAGRSAVWWGRALRGDDAVARLSAVRAFLAMEQSGPLKEALGGPERVPAAWALARLGEGSDPLVRRLRHPPGETLDRGRGIAAMLEADSELACFEAASRLGESAIPALLDLFRRCPPPDVCEAAAWALGRLGRCILPEACDSYRRGSPRVRRWIARALWYLGPEAAGAAGLLLGHPSAEATVLAMESAAS